MMSPAFAQDKQIKIAHIYSKTGPLEAYGKQTATGFMMGLDYATGGTMMVPVRSGPASVTPRCSGQSMASASC